MAGMNFPEMLRLVGFSNASLTEKLEQMLDRLEVNDNGRRVLAQICATGRVKADDVNWLIEIEPQLFRDIKVTRDTVRQQPILWNDFVDHLNYGPLSD